MKRIKNIYIKFLPSLTIVGWLLMGGLSLNLYSCKDDLEIDSPSEKDPSMSEEGDALTFTLQLNKEISTRSVDYDFGTVVSDYEKYENYIDTQDKFRIFFFTAQGDFIFGATDRVVASLDKTSDQEHDYWYVRIPMNMLVDRDNQEYDVVAIKEYLKSKPFKIAVLANWPNKGEKINPADYDDGEGDSQTSQNPSSILKGNPRWSWKNSILNPEASKEDIRNINDLHHVYNDLFYSDDSPISDGIAKGTLYGPFMSDITDEDNKSYKAMGEPSDWVQMRPIESGVGSDLDRTNEKVVSFDSKETANQWIREHGNPNVDINENKTLYRHYQHLWFLWNFDASYKYGLYKQNSAAYASYAKAYEENWGWNDQSPATPTNKWGEQWYGRNGQKLYNWMTGSTATSSLPYLKIDIGEKDNDVFFEYKNGGGNAIRKQVGNNFGIQLPAIGTSKISSSTAGGYIKFQARTSGTLRIKWSSADGTASRIAIQKSTTQKIHPSDVTDTKPTDFINPDDNQGYYDVSVGDDSQPMYIYCTKGKAVIYSIEFIRGKYLYDTDREGVAPSEDHPIPMYGVQDFPAISDWERGTTHNLNGNIYLVRSLSKVIVYIKKEFGKPRHMYMKSMNRAARCEPMDVETSTYDLWAKGHTVSFTGYNEKLCELYAVRTHGASYNMAQSNYQKWLSWFYGSWKNASWLADYVKDNSGNWDTDTDHSGWKFNNAVTPDIDEYTPHLFNSYIYRSDFCRFLFAGEDPSGQYWKYVLYMPDKNIDDPTTVGKMSSTPKIPHIEYRFDPKNTKEETNKVKYANTEYNLDDNDCFRIYFTNYGKSSSNGNVSNSLFPVNTKILNQTNSDYDGYEKDNSQIGNYHWPIVRNHIYEFWVGGVGPENPDILVKVKDWAHEKITVEW